MNETNHFKFKKRAATLAVASCISLLPWVAEAAGIGKLTVLSGLGQPLRAELDIAASRDELTGMTARLAPQEAFRQAGIDYASVLLDLRFTLEKKPTGQAVVKVTSVKPVNEPFLDFLVELNWPAGRLVREYTFLLDPPEIAARQSARPAAEARVVETVQGGGGQQSSQSRAKVVPYSAPAAKLPAESEKAEASRTRLVERGDTLRKIADETRYEGVSLEQMLVGLFRNNPDAFVGKNINRLKAGAILGIPEKTVVESVSEVEAKEFYVTQAGDWNAYRQKVAARTAQVAAKEAEAGQSSSGKIAAKVEEKLAPAEQAKDQVKVSSTELQAKGAAAGKTAASEADQLAKGKALQEAQERLALLEKNVGELQKLVEMKNQKLAELQQQRAVQEEKAAPVEPAKQVEPAKATEELKPVVPEKPLAATPLEPPKPIQPTPPKAQVPASMPESGPSVLDSLLEDPLPLIGGGGILALLAGYFFVKRRRNQDASLETTAAPGPSSLGPNSVFRMTGGQSIDTGNTPPQTGDFSQTGPGTIDTDEVDPVAEADVYMAYGRDTQAEEILLEALQKDPQRTAIHAKLLEIYANRGSLKQFETLASELYAQTGGVGADWEKAAALGVNLDPNNPLYSSSRSSEPFDANATMIISAENVAKASLAMTGAAALSLGESVSGQDAGVESLDLDALELQSPNDDLVVESAADEIGADSDDEVMSLDFDLGLPGQVLEEPVEPEAVVVGEAHSENKPSEDSSSALDFDLGNEEAPTPAKLLEEELDISADQMAEGVDFDLDFSAQTEDSDAAQDFSPEGTLVMSSPIDEDAGISTFIGFGSAPDSPFAEEPSVTEESPIVDFDLDVDSLATQTLVNPTPDHSGAETLVHSGALNEAMDFDDPKLADTIVNTGVLDADSFEFDVKLTDSVFLGQPMVPPDFDMGAINLDLAADSSPAETVEDVAATVAESVVPVEVAAGASVDPAHWEEVNTKLDLAKAYEEMGDLEGARELLEEVVGEGPDDLVEQARAILGRIGE